MNLVGRYTYLLPIIEFGSGGKCIIGSFCSIGKNVVVYLGGNHRTEWVTTYPFGHINENIFTKFNGEGHPTTKGDVIIGSDVWIGNNVTIMSGVSIGDGAVISNNSHVVKNVEAYSIVGGNPARFIKFRFSPEQIHKLLEIQWWNWHDEKINEFTPLLCSGDIDLFINTSIQVFQH